MTTMSDDGERTCPLCTEEMDLTDQQLKPCKCGYEICVWCWHHIIDMAEKEDAEGRCPACRTPYDKERIVGMATNSRRLAAEASAEKKQKSQKLKPKTSVEAKKHLNSVRVIQRNLVYIIGLPSNLCEESILERKEYFGQYGKVLKVSISRPTSAPSQQTSNNNTLSVYITYAKESEAIRCIQVVHNYVLEGKSLRACFGTTKYCHAWLKNMICSNPDCLYLHDIGSQEDSFTKDEIVSAYTRVPQVASASSQRRYGNVLPPPMDEFLSNGSKNQSRSTTSSAPIQVKGSPPKNSGKSTGLPSATSWGDRSANCHSSTANVACSQPIKQKAEAINYASSPPLLSKNTSHPAAWHDDVDSTAKKPEVRDPPLHPSAWDDEIADMKVPERKEALKASGISQLCESIKLDVWKGCQLVGSANTGFGSDLISRTPECSDVPMIKTKPSDEGNVSYLEAKTRQTESLGPVTELKSQTYVSDVSSVGVSDAECATEMSLSSIPILMVSTSKNKERGMLINVKSSTQLSNPMSNGHGKSSLRTDPERVREDSTNMGVITQSLNSNFPAASIDSDAVRDQLNVEHYQNSKCSFAFSQSQDPSLIPGSVSKDPSLFDVCGQNVVTDRTLKSLKQGLTSKTSVMINPLLHCDNENHTVSDEIDHPSSSSYHNHSQTCDVEKKKISAIGKNNGIFHTALSLRDKEPLLTNGYKDHNSGSFSIPRKVFGSPEFNCTEEKISLSPSGSVSNIGNHNKSANLDVKGESNIITDILSLDFDPWDDSLFSSGNFTRFLGETGKLEGSFNLSDSFKSQSSHQSRFSFARQESQANISEPLLREESQPKKFDLSQDVYKKGYQNGMLFNGSEGSKPVISSHDILSDRSSGMSKVNVSAPPGFTAPNRVPPPGFSPQDRFNQTYDTSYSDNHLSSSVGNHYQAPLIGNSGDVEFIDPAILAIGKEQLPLGSNNSGLNLKYTFPAQFSTPYSDPRLQLLMQQSISSHQNLRMSDTIADRLLPSNESYVTSRLLAQNQNTLPSYLQMQLQHPTNSHFTNGQWDGWNDVRLGNDIGMSEIFRNGRFGLNNYYSSNEEHKFHLPVADVYNSAFGL